MDGSVPLPPPDEYGRRAASAAPPGLTSNFDNPEYIGHRVIISNAVFTFLSLLFVLLRLHTRIHISRAAGLEDVFIAAAWLVCLAAAICSSFSATHGIGKHFWDVEINELVPTALLMNTISSFVSLLANLFTKMAMIQLMIRIGSHVKKLRWCYYILMFVTVACNLSAVFAIALRCNPPKAQWYPQIPNSKCINPQKIFQPFAIVDVIISFVIFLSPLPLVWNFSKRMPRQQKIAIGFIFAIGSVTWIVSAIRAKATFEDFRDLTWQTTDILCWWTIETNVSIICACAFTLKPFARRYIPTLSGFGSTAAASRTGKSDVAMQPIRLGPPGKQGLNTSMVTARNEFQGTYDSDSERELVDREQVERAWTDDGNIVVERSWDVEVAPDVPGGKKR